MHKIVMDAVTATASQVPLSADEQSDIAARRAEAEAARPALSIAAVKAEATRRITLICPDWKQRNLTARAAELAIKGPSSWTADEEAEVAAGQALWIAIKAIRGKSDLLEALIATLTPDQLSTFNPLDPAHWPS